MKTTILLGMLGSLAFVVFIRSSVIYRETGPESARLTEMAFPVEVKAIIDQKCYGCHSMDGKSKDAKESLMWDSIPQYPKVKQLAKLNDIIDVLDDGSMPPEKFIEMEPGAKLTKEQRRILKSWAEQAADELLN